MPDHEHTSPDIATKAAKVLRMSDGELIWLAKREPQTIRALAASALTQALDRKGDGYED